MVFWKLFKGIYVLYLMFKLKLIYIGSVLDYNNKVISYMILKYFIRINLLEKDNIIGRKLKVNIFD